MKKNIFILCSLLCLLFISCQEKYVISVNCLEPAKYNFPDEIKRIGVVNNVLESDTISERYQEKKGNEFKHSTANFIGNGKIASESLAKAIVDQNYFDQVIICDSVLRKKNMPAMQERLLTQEEVNSLANGLQVDAILSVDKLSLSSNKLVYDSRPNGFHVYVFLNINPTIRVYYPLGIKPIKTIIDTDTIYWDYYAHNLQETDRLLDYGKIIGQASDYVGNTAIKSLLPHWGVKSRNVYSYDMNTNLRNAVFYAKKGDWDKAYNIWEKEYNNTKKIKTKFYMAMNIALYYEMKTNIKTAISWAKEANNIITKYEAGKGRVSPNKYTTSIKSCHSEYKKYLKQLNNRLKDMPLLDKQTARFAGSDK